MEIFNKEVFEKFLQTEEGKAFLKVGKTFKTMELELEITEKFILKMKEEWLDFLTQNNIQDMEEFNRLSFLDAHTLYKKFTYKYSKEWKYFHYPEKFKK